MSRAGLAALAALAALVPAPALAEPADLTAALQRNVKAAAAWANFSPSSRREYIEWIIEAKRPETREQRLLTTIEWTAEGNEEGGEDVR